MVARPTTVNFEPARVTVLPTVRLFCLAYEESTTITAAAASEARKSRPEVMAAVDSGPMSGWLVSTPSSVVGWTPTCAFALDECPSWKFRVPDCPSGLLSLTVPLTLMSKPLKPPATDLTPSRWAILPSAVSLIVPCPSMGTTLSVFVFADLSAPEVPLSLNICGPPLPALGAWVTVRSVPTPYSECSTADCAVRTPAEAAVTVITRPTSACRDRRRSSLRR
jgi:hypothetical protein